MSISELDKILEFKTYEEEIEHEAMVLASRFLSAVSPIGMKKRILAEKMNMKAPHVTKVFKGDKLPSIEFMAKLQKAMGVRFEIRAIPLVPVVIPDVVVIKDVPRETIKKETPKDGIRPTTWDEKKAYCKKHDISMTELEKRFR